MKKGARLIFIVLCMVVISVGCNMEWNSKQSSEKSSGESVEKQPQYGKTIVDNLRMRNSSGLGGQEITQIGKNQMVRLTGNQSDSTESISIRGTLTPHYWHEIIFNGDTGWVYGGGLEIMDSLEVAAGGGLNDYMIEPNRRVGIVTKDDTHASLVQKLSPGEVIKENLQIGEDQTVQGTILYPNTNNELRIYWQNEDFEHLRQIIISKPGGEWRTGDGIHVGLSISEITSINGTPFELTGFQWDFAGTTLNWQGGKLNPNLTLSFDYHGDISIYPFLIGDKVISSDNSSLLKLKPQVRQILVSFNQ